MTDPDRDLPSPDWLLSLDISYFETFSVFALSASPGTETLALRDASNLDVDTPLRDFPSPDCASIPLFDVPKPDLAP